MLRLLPCFHSFHQPCVDEWLLKDREGDPPSYSTRHRGCPLCKRDPSVAVVDVQPATTSVQPTTTSIAVVDVLDSPPATTSTEAVADGDSRDTGGETA